MMYSNKISMLAGAAMWMAACGGSSNNAPAPEAQPTAAVAADQSAQNEAPPTVKSAGAAGGYVNTAGTLSLNDDQRSKLRTIAMELAQDTEPLRQSEQEVAKIVADGIPSGKIDRKQLTPALDRLATAEMAAKPAVAKSINSIHALFTPEQRKEFASAYKTQLGMVRENFAADVESMKAQLRQMGSALDLSDSQKTKLQAKIQNRINERLPKVRAEVQELIDRRSAAADAFPNADFDANKFVKEGSDMKPLIEQRVAFFEQLMTDLTPEQRNKLSAIVRMGFGL